MDDSPLYITPFIAYKVLEHRAFGRGQIVSPYRNSYCWFPERKTLEADCRTSDSGSGWNHPTPNDECHCGFYGYYAFEDAQNTVELFSRSKSIDCDFIVLVKAWGEVVLHEKGLRSQFMDVIAVHSGHYTKKDAIREYAQKIGVPYLNRNELEDYAQERGIVPDERMF